MSLNMLNPPPPFRDLADIRNYLMLWYHQFKDGIIVADVNSGASGTFFPTSKAMKYITIIVSAQGEGNLDLSDADNWNVDTALIDTIIVKTSSTDWDLVLYPDDDFDASGSVQPITLAKHASGGQVMLLGHAYKDYDESKEVHLQYTDNAGADTADIMVLGRELV